MKKIMTLAAIGAIACSGAALAHFNSDESVVRDYRGQQVNDERGHCVYTNWNDAGNACGGIGKLSRSVYFDFNRSNLKKSERAKLDKLISALRKAKSIESVTLVGTADRVGKSDYNQRLSQKRANVVKQYLTSNGVKVRGVQMRAIGESAPVTKCAKGLKHSELVACLAADRRTDVELNYRQ